MVSRSFLSDSNRSKSKSSKCGNKPPLRTADSSEPDDAAHFKPNQSNKPPMSWTIWYILSTSDGWLGLCTAGSPLTTKRSACGNFGAAAKSTSAAFLGGGGEYEEEDAKRPSNEKTTNTASRPDCPSKMSKCAVASATCASLTKRALVVPLPSASSARQSRVALSVAMHTEPQGAERSASSVSVASQTEEHGSKASNGESKPVRLMKTSPSRPNSVRSREAWPESSGESSIPLTILARLSKKTGQPCWTNVHQSTSYAAYSRHFQSHAVVANLNTKHAATHHREKHPPAHRDASFKPSRIQSERSRSAGHAIAIAQASSSASSTSSSSLPSSDDSPPKSDFCSSAPCLRYSPQASKAWP
mmetsp:Transcript_63708/g.206893  ORF Transcript_63708/g.206893 Transcript_63708/m.206893 type:complete len:359 (+) Transcript_63708:518-1594(+)